MLKLYYTTTAGEDQPQQNYYNSLGGYKSSNQIASDEFDNFFGEISSTTLSKNNQNQYIAIILKNEGGGKTNINFWFERAEGCYSKLYIAAVDLAADNDGIYYMENVKSFNSAPIYATFYECENEESAVNLGDLATGEMLGLWVKREILTDIASSDIDNLVIQDPNDENKVVQNSLSQLDTIEMKFSYD